MFAVVNINNVECEFFFVNEKGEIMLENSFTIATNERKTSDQIMMEINNSMEFFLKNKTQFMHIVIMSTIPKFTDIVKKFSKSILKVNPIILDKQTIPMKIEDIHTEASALTIANAMESMENGDNTIVVNFEPIISISVCIDSKFIGYSLYPNFETISDCIHKNMPNIPNVLFSTKSDFFDNKNYEATQIGIFNGCIGALDHIIKGIKEVYPKKHFSVIATGKSAVDFAKFSKEINIVDENMRIKSAIKVIKKKMLSV